LRNSQAGLDDAVRGLVSQVNDVGISIPSLMKQFKLDIEEGEKEVLDMSKDCVPSVF
jgi:hypothetical protein